MPPKHGYGMKSRADLARVVKGVREIEKVVRSAPDNNYPVGPGSHAPLIVQVTGALVTNPEIPSGDITNPYPGESYFPENGYYPGVIVYRDELSVAEVQNWFTDDENCLIDSINDEPLQIGRRYTGVLAGTRNGTPVVLVDTQSTTVCVEFGGCRTVTADATLDPEDLFVYIDATAGNITVTLPAWREHDEFYFQRIDNTGNTVTIQRAGTNTVNGGTSATITSQYSWVHIAARCTSGAWAAFAPGSGGAGALLAANNLSDLANAATARTNLGLGTAAVQNIGTSGASVPLLSTANTWTLAQTFSTNPVVSNSEPAVALVDTGAGTIGFISGNGGLVEYFADALGAAVSSAHVWYIDGATAGNRHMQLTTTALDPVTNDSHALGTATVSWSDLFLATGGVINWGNGNATVTHSTGLLTVSVPVHVGTIELGDVADTTLARSSAGDMTIEGKLVYRADGTDVPVADGGTGRSSHTAYAVICGGTSTTAAQQSVASVGVAAQTLQSGGAGALPTFEFQHGEMLGNLVTATDESTTGAGPANLATDATFSINTGETVNVEFEAHCETYNSALASAIHTLTIEVDGVDTTFAFNITAINTIYQFRARIIISVTTGAKTCRLQFGTNGGTARFRQRTLTATRCNT